MTIFKTPLRFWLLGLFICLCCTSGKSQKLKLKVAGNQEDGFHVEIYHNNQKIVTNSGEFSLLMSNLDLSTESKIESWKGTQWTGDENSVILTQDHYIKGFDANLSAKVSYRIVNDCVIEKCVELMQSSMPSMYYMMEQSSLPAETPQKYVSFEHDNYPGGFVHELFPSVGFVTKENKVVGFLTDAGYKNHFTRTTRRRFSGQGGGFVGMRKLPDPELFSVATPEEQADNIHYIKQTFGELYNLDAGSETLMQTFSAFQKEGKVKLVHEKDLITLQCEPSGQTGFSFVTPMKDHKVYTISFLCKGNTTLALKLFRIRNGEKAEELEHGVKYIDNFPIKEDVWTQFKGSVLVPYIGNDSVSLFVGTTSGKKATIQIKNLSIAEHQPQREPYNVMPQGKRVQKATYLFVEPYTTHRDFMISSQARLAEGKGFKGSLIEKMLYANLNMLTWITSVNDFTPFNVPNMNYAPDMYNRDSFWSIVATYNKELNLSIWEKWGNTQTAEGAIGTIITPYMGSVEAKDNEATIEWLIWALLNKRRFGLELPDEKIQKAVDYVLNSFDEDRNGKCQSHFSMSQIDICEYKPKTDRLAVNQGMFAVALRTIHELGFDVSEVYIQKAEKEYQNFYDKQRKHLLFDRDYPDIISLTDLVPEFLSLWLFNQPMLTDQMVINHLEQVPILNKVTNSPHPEYGTTAPICVRLTNNSKGYAYLTSDYQPFGEFGQANYKDGARDGYYYNGGSWFRAEYCAYVTGLKHGWKKAPKLMENRAWAEIYLNPKSPFSKEFIPTQWTTTDSWWNSTRGLCWNVFILMADELAGLRLPNMDPDYSDENLK
ncbi:MAG: hypothetical protein JEZ03_11145 [Bacteroidales bacterium]|nr:hypothetical protein [Bacteroidales bacterium]